MSASWFAAVILIAVVSGMIAGSGVTWAVFSWTITIWAKKRAELGEHTQER
jgi:hypothetical protein